MILASAVKCCNCLFLQSEPLSTHEYDTEDVEMFETGDEETVPNLELMRQRQEHRLFSNSASVQSTRGSTSADPTKPLFVHLTSSVHNERVNLSVKDIPVCFCKYITPPPPPPPSHHDFYGRVGWGAGQRGGGWEGCDDMEFVMGKILKKGREEGGGRGEKSGGGG